MIGYWCSLGVFEDILSFFEVTHLTFLILKGWISMDACFAVGAMI